MNTFETPAAQAVGITTTDAKIKNSGIKTMQGIFEMYKKKNDKLKMADFADVYSEEEIMKDKGRVEYFKKSKDYNQPTEHGIVLENMFCDLVEKYEWFGKGAKVVQLSEFDDMNANGAHCDAVLEIPMEDGFVVRVGIDLTTAVNYDVLNKKKSKCMDGVLSGKLFSVKYFKSKVDQTKRRISDVPVLFAGMNKENLEALCASIAKQENTEKDIVSKIDTQFMFFDQFSSQLEKYADMAEEKHGPDAVVTTWLEFYRELFEWIAENKKSLRPNNFGQKASGDEVYKYITRFV
ncbi:MAG: hypothetical protein HGA36_00110 [Candidatus Moranbacteria bacterium]|nr:hypothetical protein [Candidatus Moranbacteria bacterium]